MKSQSPRRTFLKQSALLGGGRLVARAGTKPCRAAKAPPAANETLKTIQSLRTIHGNFVDKPIPDADLQTILQASVRAANASNMQSYSIVVVKDPKKMKQICTYQGGCLLVYCVDFNRFADYAAHFMDWWAKEWLGHSEPAKAETPILRFLKRSGFVEAQQA